MQRWIWPETGQAFRFNIFPYTYAWWMDMLTFIVPTLNEEKHIDEALKGLKPQLSGNDEVIVVDAHSKDRTAEIAARHGAKVILRPKKGVGIARTEGAKEA